MSILVGLVAEAYETLRYRNRRVCDHWMIQKPGGPMCQLCKRAWAWRLALPDDE